MLDWPRERLIGGPFGRWVVRDDRDLFARHLGELQEGDGRLSQELRVRTRSGWPVHVRLGSVRVAGAEGTPACRSAMVSAHRCAERQARLLQSRLTHAARLGTVGALASCLAHDLNQPLGTIVLNCDAALRMLRTGSGDQKSLAEALSQASAAAACAGEMTRHLRSFLRKEGTPTVAVELPGLIADAMRLMEAEARDRDVRIEAECGPDLPAVLVEAVHIEAGADQPDRERDRGDAQRGLRHPADHDPGAAAADPTRTAERRGHRTGHGPQVCGAGLPAVLHDQARRHGHGAFDQPRDHRGPWRQALGRARPGDGRRPALHPASHRRWGAMSSDPAAFVIDDEPSFLEALVRTLRGAGLRWSA